jgi:predicted transcriptional regulator
MAQASILVQLDSEVEARLAALAEARKQPVSDLAAEVIAQFLNPESWEHQHIRAGLAELESGEGISNERVLEWLDSWGTGNELPAPK